MYIIRLYVLDKFIWRVYIYIYIYIIVSHDGPFPHGNNNRLMSQVDVMGMESHSSLVVVCIDRTLLYLIFQKRTRRKLK